MAALFTGCTPTVQGWGGAFVASDTAYLVGADQRLLALNLEARSRGDSFPATGEWRFPTADDQKLGTSFSHPVVADGVVYASSYAGPGASASQPGLVVAVEAASGNRRWLFTLPTPTGQVVGSPTVTDRTVYFGSSDYQVYALEASSGTLKWSYKTRNRVWGGVAVDGDTAYVASLDHHLYALDKATGTLKWEFESKGAIASAPVVAQGTIYAGSADGKLYAIDGRTGAERWSAEMGSWVWGTPFVDGGSLYAGTLDGQVHLLDAGTGRTQWSQAIKPGGPVSPVSASPLLVAGVLVVGAQDGRVYGFDPRDGRQLWTYNTDPNGPIFANLATDGSKVYVVSMNHRLIALDPRNGTAPWVCHLEKPCRG